MFRNTDKNPSRGAVLNALKLNLGKDAGLYMFHANTLENAKDIVGDQGINPKKGRKNCDFGHGGSFYLTADFDHAQKGDDARSLPLLSPPLSSSTNDPFPLPSSRALGVAVAKKKLGIPPHSIPPQNE